MERLAAGGSPARRPLAAGDVENLGQTSCVLVVVNNAGVAAAGVSEAFTDEQASALFDVNVIGLHRVTRAVLPVLRSQEDGLIINIGLILGRVTFPFFGIYNGTGSGGLDQGSWP